MSNLVNTITSDFFYRESSFSKIKYVTSFYCLDFSYSAIQFG